MAADLLLRCSPVRRALALEVAGALAAAGFEVALPDLGGDEPTGARGWVLLVTREWSRSPELGRALEAARAAGVPTWIAWWDEDAPSDFLGDGNGGAADILYLCLLPRPERAAKLVAEIRAELGAG